MEWVSKLNNGLNKTASGLSKNLSTVFKGKKLDPQTLEDLEDLLISSDFGVSISKKIVDSISKEKFNDFDTNKVREFLSKKVSEILKLRYLPLNTENNGDPYVILVVGVNGVGKTTTIGKLANNFVKKNKNVLIAAGDTFRAAAIDQLKIWSDRSKSEIITKPTGTDAAALSYEALVTAKEEKKDILIIDTAGRLQNKTDLMNQLEKIPRVLKKIDETSPHSVLLVLDASTGQNAISQVELFNKSCGVTGLIMTKLDGTAKGGVLVSIAERYPIPIHAIGVGEGIDDLQEFEPESYSRALLGLL
ncbi:MAG: signal recognition particle-docking protein FtsY [Rhodospirillaceae bacterium]|nr:signal recognition particle-docking protein FtsY [Rhodospirillaceae bacterium]|tara:strand:- start:58471 stop:59382 length:912 start_codon:yes stop_codon:yes gene_type:complete